MMQISCLLWEIKEAAKGTARPYPRRIVRDSEAMLMCIVVTFLRARLPFSSKTCRMMLYSYMIYSHNIYLSFSPKNNEQA